jgi:hypothetical protein
LIKDRRACSRFFSAAVSALDRYRVVINKPAPTGKVTLAMDFKCDGGGMAKGGTDTVGERQEDWRRPHRKTTPSNTGSSRKGHRRDTGRRSTSVCAPFKFTGRLGKVMIDLKTESGAVGRALQ